MMASLMMNQKDCAKENCANLKLNMTDPAITLLILLLCVMLRIAYLILIILTTDCKLEKSDKSLRTLLCIGSGGHTTELLRLVKNLDSKKYYPRLYVVAKNDINSEVKICEVERIISDEKFNLSKIPRSRNVNQSFFSSVPSTLYASIYTIPVVFHFKPDIILCNGPGTCIPVCVIAFFLRCMFLLNCRIVFIESICRVRTLSLTGKILQCFADIIVVQWPQLRDVCLRAKYFGRLT